MTFRFPSRVPALGAAALAFVGALAWVGCGSGDGERYYCDDSGCYNCDAYGCSGVTAPTSKPCTGKSSCDSGQVCTSGGCAQTCSTDATCPKGTVCKSGVCSAPTAPPPGPTKECTTKTDCASGQVCVNNACQACGGSAGPCPCQGASDCGADQMCVAGSCTSTTNTCKYSSECAAGKICADGQCLTGCDTSSCGDGFTCTKGVCEPVGPGPNQGCSGDAQCMNPAAPKCVSGSCVPSCNADPDCGAGRFCDQGACVVDTRPTPNCANDTDCANGTGAPRKCLGGFCKYTCTTAQGDAYCRTIDNRIGYCAKDGVCRTQAEANASCVQKSDCAAGQDCIDNQCK